MECRRCASPLDRPGDYCLVCHTGNADAVVVVVDDERATLTILDEETVVATTEVATTPEADPELERAYRRNFAGRIADEIRRKRPDAVYATGDREVLEALRGDVHFDLYRVPEEDPVEAVVTGRGEPALDVVDEPPAAKLGGAHSTLIGGRTGQRAVRAVAGHPHVKKIVPGPITSGGGGSRGGLRAKVTRADEGGNVRLLVRDGSTVQETRIVTTAPDRETGERIRDDLAEALAADGLDGEGR